MKRAAGAIAMLLGIALSYASVQLAISGTGMQVPDDVVGLVGEGELHASPAGEPFLYGEVRLARPGSKAFEQSWSAEEGSPEIVVEGREYRVPPPSRWQGLVPVDTAEVDSLTGLPVVAAIEEEAQERLSPPYLIQVEALRPGDRVAMEVQGDRAVDLYVGAPDELTQWHDAREEERWPIVIMFGVLGIASIALGWRLVREVR